MQNKRILIAEVTLWPKNHKTSQAAAQNQAGARAQCLSPKHKQAQRLAQSSAALAVRSVPSSAVCSVLLLEKLRRILKTSAAPSELLVKLQVRQNAPSA